MTVALSYLPIQAFRDNNGFPLVGGQLFSYQGGTSTPAPTYTDSTGATPLPNPIILNARGETAISTGTSSGLWIPPNTAYKFVLQDIFGNTIWTIDQVYAPVANLNASLGAIAVNIVPSSDNTYSLGSALNSWANVYVGDEGAPVLDTTSGNIGFYDETAAETAAGITPVAPVWPPGDVRRYGADPTGVSDSGTAINNAFLASVNGTVVSFPKGTFTVAGTLTLANRTGVVVRGANGYGTTADATLIKFTQTGAADCLTATHTQGITLEDLQLIYTSGSYVGTVLNMSGTSAANPSSRNIVNRCSIGGSGTNTASVLLSLDKAINCRVNNCEFYGAAVPIQGQANAGGSFSNANQVRSCDFSNFTAVAIRNLGDGWLINGNTFEPSSAGGAFAIQTVSAAPSYGVEISGNWFGDATASNFGWITLVSTNGVHIAGNYFTTNTGPTVGVGVYLTGCSGVSIDGNIFASINTGILIATSCPGCSIKGNDFSISCTTPLSATLVHMPNADLFGNNPSIAFQVIAANGYRVLPEGLIEQWGSATVTTGTPLAITFATNGIAFPNNLFNLQLTLITPSGANTVDATSPSATGFTANVAGTAGTSTVDWRALGN